MEPTIKNRFLARMGCSSVLDTILTGDITWEILLTCTATSLVLGVVCAIVFMFRNTYTKSFVITLALLPAIVQTVIMLVNGNLGTGVAVMGAFSLVRFRSVPGSAREICSLFLAMALGLATGMGYIGIAVFLAVVLNLVQVLLVLSKFGEGVSEEKELKITIPESLDYTGIFDDIFVTHTRRAELMRVKTSNMGSLYELCYRVTLKNRNTEKQMIDEIRCRNGNLTIVCGKVPVSREEL